MKILLIGGTGSLGTKLTKFFYNSHNITVFSRDGHKQQALASFYPDVKFILGDVCDKHAVKTACEGQDIVVNCAAQKIVSQGESNVDDFIRVNIKGAEVVASTCHELGIRKSLFISSDKAVAPVNLYGKTKAVAEDIYTSYGYSVVRYGNVANSRGSFYNIWKDLISRGEKVAVRVPFPTRFILRLKDAVRLVDEVLRLPHGIYIPTGIKAISIYEVAYTMNADIQTEPMLPGEKQDEALVGYGEYAIAQHIKVDDVLFSDVAHVIKGYTTNLKYLVDYTSDSVPRMSGAEFIRLMENEK